MNRRVKHPLARARETPVPVSPKPRAAPRSLPAQGDRTLERAAGNRAIVGGVQVQKKPAAGTIQLKEETELKPGFNMIGETHTDYPNKNARRYEASQIKSVLGNDTEYLTENLLKVNPKDQDYADPVHLRVEQVIAFVKDTYDKAIPVLRYAKTLDIGEALKKGKQTKEGATAIAEQLVKRMVKGAKKDEIVEAVKSENYSLETLEKLGQYDTWKAYDPGEPYTDEIFEILQEIDEERYRREDELDDKSSSEDDQPEPVDALGVFKHGALGVMNLFNEYKGRLPITFKLYFHLKDTGHYIDGDGHFAFATSRIPAVLNAWEKIESLAAILKEIIYTETHDHLLPQAIDASLRILPALNKALNAGISEGTKGRDIIQAKEARSLAMHEAAEKIHDKKIAWKVGNLHILDIRQLENDNVIKTDYSYIEKNTFKSKYLNEQDLKTYEGGDDDLGEAYTRADKGRKQIEDSATKRLQDILTWEYKFSSINFSTLRHLDLPNLITNQTRVIVEAVEKGALPKLETLTIHKASMTPDLRGRLLSRGVEVVLTQ